LGSIDLGKESMISSIVSTSKSGQSPKENIKVLFKATEDMASNPSRPETEQSKTKETEHSNMSKELSNAEVRNLPRNPIECDNEERVQKLVAENEMLKHLMEAQSLNSSQYYPGGSGNRGGHG
ncbi:unnamed protein product, partial [Ilex paraguariensis]